MDNIDDDPSFVALPARVRKRVDKAFDSVVSPGKQSKPEVSAGGFIVEGSESQHEAGGFIIEDVPPKPSGVQSYIPLSDVPHALNLLDLSPDDDIMGVFKNAAIGWGAQNARNDGISKRDWRAVCAALLEGEHVDGSDEENPVANEDIEMGADSGTDSDEYQVEEPSDDTEAVSGDEYEEPTTTTRAKKAQKVSAKTLTKSSRAEGPRQLTKSQKAQCRQEFGRFFPHVPDNELDKQRIMIKDIVRVAGLLKENLKTEEVCAPYSTLVVLTHVPRYWKC